MRQFYAQVHVDTGEMRFYAECPQCGKFKYAKRLPFICRQKKMIPRYEQGEAPFVSQSLYNRSKAMNVQYLAGMYNFCRICGRWVCDDCFSAERGEGKIHED